MLCQFTHKTKWNVPYMICKVTFQGFEFGVKILVTYDEKQGYL